MGNQIQHSLDWAKVQISIEQPARRLKKYSHEMLKLSQNIGYMVKELSREEITCRRQQRQTEKHKELLHTINQAINEYEQYITFVVLMNG